MATKNKKLDLVSGLRSYLNRKANKRSVSANDAYSYFSKSGARLNIRQRKSAIATVLRAPDFESVGFIRSDREAAKGRMITEWDRA